MASTDECWKAFLGRTYRNRAKYPDLDTKLAGIRAAFDAVIAANSLEFQEYFWALQVRVKESGSNKALDPDMLRRYRGEWAAYSKAFDAKVAEAAKEKGDRTLSNKVEARITEAKISSLVRDVLEVISGIDLSPSEKWKFLSRLGGSLGSLPESAPAAPKRDFQAPPKKGKKEGQVQNAPRSSEEKLLKKAVTEAQEGIRLAKISRNTDNLESEDPLVRTFQERVKALNDFRSRKSGKSEPVRNEPVHSRSTSPTGSLADVSGLQGDMS